MIALVTTYFLVFYIFVPGALFRFVCSLRVRLKLFQRTRTQEATFSVVVALLPFVLALAGTWYMPILRHYPFGVAEGSGVADRQDYRQVAAILTSSDASRWLGNGPNADSAPAREANWAALRRVFRRQMRFLVWYFVAVGMEGWLFGFLASKYGDWQLPESGREVGGHRRQRLSVRMKQLPQLVFNAVAAKLILPNISEWHMLLTDFSWPKRDRFFVSVDVLQSNEHLYQGRVANYFIDSDGKLTGILLKGVSRFDRQAFQEAVKAHGAAADGVSATGGAHGNALRREDFWRRIPSDHFYIAYADITNLNVRFAPRDQTLISLASEIMGERAGEPYRIEVEGEEEDSGVRHRPDMYS